MKTPTQIVEKHCKHQGYGNYTISGNEEGLIESIKKYGDERVSSECNTLLCESASSQQTVQNAVVVSCNNCGSIKKVSDRFKDAIIFNNCYCTVYITACAECGTIINEETWVE